MPDDPALRIFPDEYVPNAEGAEYHRRWVKANPAEAIKWAKFRDDVSARKQVTPPSMATKYGRALVAAGKEHMSISHFVGAPTNPYPPVDPTPPAPVSGVLRGRFTDFYTGWGSSSSDHNGQIFQNRWNLGTGYGLQTLLAPQTPWPSTGGAAIFEVNDGQGRPGFRFLSNPEMLAGSGGKKAEITEFYGNAYGQPIARGNGYTDEVSFYIRFPSGGNPAGFPGPLDGVFDRWNVFWQHSCDNISRITGFGIDMYTTYNQPRFYGSVQSISGGGALNHVIAPFIVQLDTDYLFRFITKWTTASSGFFYWWIDGVQYGFYDGPTFASTVDTPNTEFGFYSGPVKNNEIIISNLRVTAH